MKHHLPLNVPAVLAALGLCALMSCYPPTSYRSPMLPQSGIPFQSGARGFDAYVLLNHWYSNATATFQTPFAIIDNMPPLNSGMSRDVMLAYIATDSVARVEQTTQGISWSTPNDALRRCISNLYTAVDYNPLLFRQYRNEATFRRPEQSRLTSLDWIVRGAQVALSCVAKDQREARALQAALYADNILRVRVLAIDSMPSSYQPSPETVIMQYRATVQVLDTLKGRFIPSWRQRSGPDADHGNAGSAKPNPGDACTDITYLQDYFIGVVSSEFRPFEAYDPAFCTTDTFVVDGDFEPFQLEEFTYTPITVTFSMRVGQEAVVFLTYDDWLIDSTHDYFNVRIEPHASAGALPIIGGKVRDVNRIWSNDLLMDYDAWRRRFLRIRDKILNGTY